MAPEPKTEKDMLAFMVNCMWNARNKGFSYDTALAMFSILAKLMALEKENPQADEIWFVKKAMEMLTQGLNYKDIISDPKENNGKSN